MRNNEFDIMEDDHCRIKGRTLDDIQDHPRFIAEEDLTTYLHDAGEPSVMDMHELVKDKCMPKNLAGRDAEYRQHRIRCQKAYEKWLEFEEEQKRLGNDVTLR